MTNLSIRDYITLLEIHNGSCTSFHTTSNDVLRNEGLVQGYETTTAGYILSEDILELFSLVNNINETKKENDRRDTE